MDLESEVLVSFDLFPLECVKAIKISAWEMENGNIYVLWFDFNGSTSLVKRSFYLKQIFN